VILQSGAADAVLSPDDATEVAGWVLDAVGVASPAELVERDAADLVAASARAATRAGRVWADRGLAARFLAFAPVTGTPSLPVDPRLYLAGTGGVPMVVGANADECRISPTGRDADAVRDWLARIPGIDADEVWRRYAARHDGDAALVDAAVRTDLWYRLPAARLARANADAGAPTWHYDFRWPSTFGALGAAHGIEVRFALDLLDDAEALPFYGADPPRALADTVRWAWRGFARDGAIGPDLGWPAHGPERRTLVLDDPPRTAVDVVAAEEDLWRPLFAT
jgi:carboxylesterase type B